MAEIMHLTFRNGKLETTHYANNGGVYLHKPEDYELMQYTGLKDKDEKEIYEGDILRRDWPKDSQGRNQFQIGVVGFGQFLMTDFAGEDIQGYYVKILASDSYGFNHANSEFKTVLNDTNFPEWRLVGNIFENPKLIEETYAKLRNT